MRAAWDRFWFAEASTLGLGIFRVLFAACMAWEVQNSWWIDVFAIEGGYHLPYVSWLPTVSETTYRALHYAEYGLIALFGLGVLTRTAGSLLLLIQAYLFFADQLNFRNHPYFFLLVLVLLVLGPAGNALSLQRFVRTWRGGLSRLEILLGGVGPVTYVQLIRLQVSLVYFYAGLHKLSPAFLSGRVMHASVVGALPANVETVVGWALSPSVLEGLQQTLLSSGTMRVLSWGSAVAELGLPFALWWRRTRTPAIAVGVVFHLGILFTMSIFAFSIAMIGSYVLFLDPDALRRWAHGRLRRLFTAL